MHTTLQLIELAKQRLALTHKIPLPMTDYRLCKLMGLSTQVMTGWKNGHRCIGTKFACKFAEACELPEEYVYACIERERADDPTVQSILERIAATFKGKVAMLAAILAIGVLGGIGAPSNAYAFSSTDLSIHYAKYRRTRKTHSLGSRFLRFVKLRRLQLLRVLRAAILTTLKFLNHDGVPSHVAHDAYDVTNPVGERLRRLRQSGYRSLPSAKSSRGCRPAARSDASLQNMHGRDSGSVRVVQQQREPDQSVRDVQKRDERHSTVKLNNLFAIA